MNDLRLIEDYLPIEAISAEASREKSVRKGHISTLHLWWARRPLVACRAAVYGALVPADRWVKEVKLKQPPDDETQAIKAKNGKKKGLNRKAAKEFVERLCKYPGEPRVIAEAQKHILEAHADRLTEELVEAKKTGHAPAWIDEFKFTGEKVTYDDIVSGRAPRPRVLDMFAGGGAIPLEALRLGCEAYALDLNPVAHIIQLCTLVYPQKYGRPDTSVRGMTGPKNERGETTWGGLAEEVRYWGNWVLEKVKAEIGDLYPPIPDPEAKLEEIGADAQANFEFAGDGQQRLKTAGRYLTPVAYLWTRTVRCKNPNCGATVPLVKQTWLCKKLDRFVALRLSTSANDKVARFDVVEATTENGLGFDPEAFSSRGNATCPFCGTVADNEYVKQEGVAGKMGQQLMATACSPRDGTDGKVYVDAKLAPPPGAAILRGAVERLASIVDEPLPQYGTLGFRIQPYGMLKWGQLFSPRQQACLLGLCATLRAAIDEADARKVEAGHAEAVNVLLAAMIDRIADFNSTGCTLNYTGGRGLGHTFTRHALPMVWDYAETNPFNTEAASWPSAIADVPAAIESYEDVVPAIVQRGSATAIPYANEFFDAVVTDPPYYDNVLSWFSVIWKNRLIELAT